MRVPVSESGPRGTRACPSAGRCLTVAVEFAGLGFPGEFPTMVAAPEVMGSLVAPEPPFSDARGYLATERGGV